MKNESKVILLGCIIIVGLLVLIGTSTNIGTLSTQGIAPNALSKPIITLDKTQYSLGDTVTIKIDYRGYVIPPTIAPSKAQGNITGFRVAISIMPLQTQGIKPITVKALKTGTNQYTGTTQYTIPLTGSIATITISVTAYDAKGAASPTAIIYITRAKAFVVTSVLTGPQPI